MNKIDKLLKKHKREILKLQTSCSHKEISGWVDYAWAPGHISGRVKACKECGKIMKSESYY